MNYNEHSFINQAKEFAINKHNDTGCMYGNLPYEVHLRAVVEYARAYSYVREVRMPIILAACWCHDVIEDCRVTYNDLVKALTVNGPYHEVALIAAKDATEIVYLVTNELGRDRKERALLTYPKIRRNPDAVYVKLCDRLANTQNCLDEASSMYETYKKEYPTFRYALNDNFSFSLMWADLDALNEYK